MHNRFLVVPDSYSCRDSARKVEFVRKTGEELSVGAAICCPDFGNAEAYAKVLCEHFSVDYMVIDLEKPTEYHKYSKLPAEFEKSVGTGKTLIPVGKV